MKNLYLTGSYLQSRKNVLTIAVFCASFSLWSQKDDDKKDFNQTDKTILESQFFSTNWKNQLRVSGLENGDNRSLWSYEPFSKNELDKEVFDKRDKYAKHFKNNDGSYTAHVASGPIHYFENGIWNTIYHSIEPLTNGGFINARNAIKTYYPSNSIGQLETRLSDGTLLIELRDMKLSYEANGQTIEQISIANSQGIVDRNQIKYQNVYGSNVDLRLTQHTLSRKMDYVLNSSQVLQSMPENCDYMVFEETIVIPSDVDVELTNNEILLIKNDQIIARYIKPFIKDNGNNIVRDLGKNRELTKPAQYGIYEIVENGQFLTIKLKVDANWLRDSNRIFPIIVDPTVNFNPGAGDNNQTGSIESRSNANWNWNGGTAYTRYFPNIYVGHNNNNYAGNSYDRQTLNGYSNFDITSIPDGATITGTEINFYYNDAVLNITGYAASLVETNLTHFTKCALPSEIDVLNDIRDGNIYGTLTLTGTDVSHWESLSIPATSDVTTALPLDIWGVGLHPVNAYYVDDYTNYSGNDQVEKPYIAITYVAPTISLTASLSAFSACEGLASSSQSVVVSGTSLNEDITANAPAGYEISLNNLIWSNTSLVIPGSPTLPNTTLYIRQSSTASGEPNGTLTFTSSGANDVNESLSGMVISAPTSVNAGADVLKCPNTSSTSLVGSFNLNSSAKSDSPSESIPDADVVTGVTRTLTLSNTGLNANQITSCELNVTTTFVADIEAYLYAPDNSFIKLVADRGSGGDNFVNTVFKDGAATSITSGTAPFTGEYSPEEAFSTLTGSADGVWTLKIYDDAAGDASVLDSWKINYTGGTTISWTPSTGLNSSSIISPVATPSITTAYTLSITANGCSSNDEMTLTVGSLDVSSITSDLSANDSYLWYGVTDNTWSTNSNWYKYDGSNWSEAASAPGLADKVFILDDAGQDCISSNNPSAIGTVSNLTVKNGGNLTLSGTLIVNNNLLNEGSIDLSSRTLDVKGNFTNNGTLTEGTGTVSLSGSSAQTVAGSDLAFYNLTVNNSNGVNLSNDASVSNVLTMTSGKTSLGSSHLTLGTGASISGTPSSSNMIVAAGTGELRKEFTSIGTFDFPVGTIAGGDEYSPVTLTFNNGTTFAGTEYVGVRVQDSRSSVMNSGVDTYINRNWIIEPSAGISNYNYDVELHYVDADVVEGTYTEGDIVPVKYSAGQWYQADMINSVFTNTIKQGSGLTLAFSNIMQWGGLTTFSEFGGGGGSGQPLPVELTSFNGACDNGVISLAWETASENNSSHFDVEKSRDGENWTVLSTIAAAGTSNEIISYQAVDHSATDGNNYFRLRQVDIDGTEKLYDPINVSCEAISVGYFSSYPNPSGNAFQIVVNNEDLVGECVLNMVDAQGKVIERRAIEVKPGINMFVMNQNLKPGMYFLNVSNGSNSTPVIRHSIK